MTTAQRILVIYGTLSIGFGFVLGTALTRERLRGPEASRHLVTAHLAAIIQGAVHLGLSLAIGLAALPAWLETAGALLLVGGSALFVAGATINWRQRVGDHFAERSVGWRLLATSGGAHLGGIAIVIAGVATT